MSEVKNGLDSLKRLFGKDNISEADGNYIIDLLTLTKSTLGSDDEDRDTAIRSNYAKIEAVLTKLSNAIHKHSNLRLAFSLRAPTEYDNVTFRVVIKKDLIEKSALISALARISREEIDPDQVLGGSPLQQEAKKTSSWEREVLDRFDRFLGPVNWKIVTREKAGRVIATMEPVTSPQTVVTALAGAFGITDEGLVPDGPGPVELPLSLLNNIDPTKIADKLRNLKLQAALTPYEEPQAIPAEPRTLGYDEDTKMVARLNAISGGAVKWELIYNGKGACALADRAIADPLKFLRMLGTLLDIQFEPPPPDAKLLTIPVAKLQHPNIDEKLKGVNLGRFLQPASQEMRRGL